MNYILIMVVTALFSAGGTRSVDVTLERFNSRVECLSIAHETQKLIKKHERSDTAIEYECLPVKELNDKFPLG